jgi:hypothetical protein
MSTHISISAAIIGGEEVQQHELLTMEASLKFEYMAMPSFLLMLI